MRTFAFAADEVHVSRGPGAGTEAKVERQGALEHPSSRRREGQTRKKTNKNNRLAQADLGNCHSRATVEEMLLKSLAKSGSTLVLHRRPVSRASRTSRSILPPRSFAARARPDRVAEPRSSA